MSKLLVVLAHPDDETFICGGTLAKYAAEGHDIVLACTTRGEMGRRMGVPAIATRETLAQLREEELRAACLALGISRLEFLGFRDKSLEIQPFEPFVDLVLGVINREQPDAVLTFHEKLGGHPDHCTIGAVTSEAFRKYAQKHQEARLYFLAWPGMYQMPQDYGLVPEQMIEVDATAHMLAKLNAFRAHKTQSELHEWLWRGDPEGISHLSKREYFIQGSKPFQSGLKSLL